MLAYIHLVEINIRNKHGILQYGNENIHQIIWDDAAKSELFDEVQEIQRLMVEGGANVIMNEWQMQNCSRKYGNESLAYYSSQGGSRILLTYSMNSDYYDEIILECSKCILTPTSSLDL